ncbi:MAG: maleylacetoacetate isomerase [Gammaproteobacteria bacterium]|nr:maleylacetoacetate isomerase [Gammaproteobacteria bacterium]MCW5582388.1 maleylacetoacetate isomerase [Gammaproteobacteria bacterium]
MLKIYDYFRSSASFRVRIALNVKKLDYQTIPVHLLNHGGEQFSDAYQQINPQCLVPTLQDGANTLSQSLAIIEYLEEIYPSPSLLPSHPYEKALVRAFALTIAADLHPLNNLRVLQYLTNEYKITEEQKSRWYHHWIEKGLSALEKQLTSQKSSSDFCFGDNLTLADICLIPQMYNARRFACNLNVYPTLVRIDAHCQQHPAVIKALPAEPVT